MTKGKLTLIKTHRNGWHPYDDLTKQREDGFEVWFLNRPTPGRLWHFTHYDANGWPTWYHTSTVRQLTKVRPFTLEFSASVLAFRLEFTAQ